MPPLPWMLARNARLAGVIVGALATLGCGPSLRLVEQANVYFERCHAGDRDPARTDLERRACWQAWHDHYQVGQPDDRISYMHERLLMLDPASRDAVALSSVEPDGLGALGATPPTGGAEIAGEATAPPEGPELSDSVARRPARARRRPVAPRTRASACGVSCEPAFVSCAGRCEIADRGCTDACRHVFRQCARGCF